MPDDFGDRCPGHPGVDPDGCGALVGVQINGTALFTKSRNVTLTIIPPRRATGFLVSNEGGFPTRRSSRSTGSGPVTKRWTLPGAGKESETKLVYLRFVGPGIPDTNQLNDSILLDQLPPVVSKNGIKATQTQRGGAPMCQIRVPARDRGRKGQRSEVRNVRLLGRRNKVLASGRAGSALNVRPSALTGQVRAIARDRAGNNSQAVTVKTGSCRRDRRGNR